MSNLAETIKRSPSVGWLLLLVVMAAVFVLGLLASGITAKRAEVASVFNNLREPINSTVSTFVPSSEPSKDHDKSRQSARKWLPSSTI